METLIKDAFNPGLYANHIPTNVIAKKNETLKIIAITAALIVIGIVAYKVYEMNLEQNKASKKRI